MKRRDTYRTLGLSGERRIPMLMTLGVMVMLSLGTVANAQTRTTRDTATAYGARLNAKGEPANLNPNRINNRAASRLDTRLSLRIERYRPDSSVNQTMDLAMRMIDTTKLISPSNALDP